MIKLKKGDEPQILKENAHQWLKTLKDKIASGDVPTIAEKTRYRHPDIKQALVLETGGKCAYCESKILHISFGDVEHISPKSEKLDDTFRWNNLTLACDKCNTYKANVADILDPYLDDPSEFFKFFGPMVFAVPRKKKATTTLTQLRLNRPELIESRAKRLSFISSLLLTIEYVTDKNLKAVLINDLLQNEASERNEYAAFVRTLLGELSEHLN